MYCHGGIRVEVDPQISNGVGGKNPIITDPDWMVGNLMLPAPFNNNYYYYHHHHNKPIAVKCYGTFSARALSVLTTLGERLTSTSGDLREMSYLFQRLSVIVLYSVSIRT